MCLCCCLRVRITPESILKQVSKALRDGWAAVRLDSGTALWVWVGIEAFAKSYMVFVSCGIFVLSSLLRWPANMT